MDDTVKDTKGREAWADRDAANLRRQQNFMTPLFYCRMIANYPQTSFGEYMLLSTVCMKSSVYFFQIML